MEKYDADGVTDRQAYTISMDGTNGTDMVPFKCLDSLAKGGPV